jgi:catechol 2,3-dioxygenase-like lactoylglutathione lyase family enzyme
MKNNEAKRLLSLVTLVVADYDEALSFYCGKLGFVLIEDKPMEDSKRWVVAAPSHQQGCHLLFAKAVNEEQRSRIGNQTGGRVFLFLTTDNFERDFNEMINNGITVVRPPRSEPYGTVAVIADLYGNLIDVIG